MTLRRVVLTILAVVLGVATFLLSTTDVFDGDHNCGSAIFPKDLDQAPQPADDPIEEEFEVTARSVRCSQAIGRQRFLAIAALLGAIGAAVAAVRWRRREPAFPGDPIV